MSPRWSHCLQLRDCLHLFAFLCSSVGFLCVLLPCFLCCLFVVAVWWCAVVVWCLVHPSVVACLFEAWLRLVSFSLCFMQRPRALCGFCPLQHLRLWFRCLASHAESALHLLLGFLHHPCFRGMCSPSLSHVACLSSFPFSLLSFLSFPFLSFVTSGGIFCD